MLYKIDRLSEKKRGRKKVLLPRLDERYIAEWMDKGGSL